MRQIRTAAVALAMLLCGCVPAVVVGVPAAIVGAGGGSNGSARVFVPGPTFAVEAPSAIACGDVTGDGEMDLVIASAARGRVTIVHNGIPGRSAVPFRVLAEVDVAVGDLPSAMAIGDLDHNGLADVAIADGVSTSITVIFRRSPNDVRTFVTPAPARDIAIGDVNRDGAPDLVATLVGLPSIAVLLNLRGAQFGAAQLFPASLVGLEQRALTLGDFRGDPSFRHDGDGNLDIAVSGPAADIAVLQGDGHGSFAAPVVVERAGASTLAFMHLGTVSFDDLCIDASDTSGFGDRLFYLERSHGIPTPWSTVRVSEGVSRRYATEIVALAPGEFDGDERPDLVLLGAGGEVAIQSPTQDTIVAVRVPDAVGLCVADLNGDGQDDVAVVSSAGKVSVFFGTRVGRAPVRIGSRDLSIAMGSVDTLTPMRFRDACPEDPEFAVANQTTRLLRVDNLASAVALDAVPRDVLAVDLNGDRRDELMVAMEATSSLALVRASAVTFTSTVSAVPLAGEALALAAGDIDDDGDQDVLVARADTNAIDVLKNDGTGTFGSISTITTAGPPLHVAVTSPVIPLSDSVALRPFTARPTIVALSENVVELFDADGARLALRELEGTPTAMAIGDVDFFGRDLLVIATTAPNTIVVLDVRTLDENSESRQTRPLPMPVGVILFAELNDDPWPDLVLGAADRPTVLLVPGDTGPPNPFGTPLEVSLPPTTGTHVTGLSIAGNRMFVGVAGNGALQTIYRPSTVRWLTGPRLP